MLSYWYHRRSWLPWLKKYTSKLAFVTWGRSQRCSILLSDFASKTRYQGRGTFMTWQLELLSRLAMELCLNLFHWFIPESSYCTLSQWCTAPWDRSAFKMTMHGKCSKFHWMFEFPMVYMNKVWGPCCHLTSAYNLWDYIHLIFNTFAIPNYTTIANNNLYQSAELVMSLFTASSFLIITIQLLWSKHWRKKNWQPCD